MGIGKHYVSAHAFKRMKERWPTAAALSKRALLEWLASSIESARAANTYVRAPGGLYVPFELDSEEGFLVIKDDCVVTVLPREWAEEVSEYLKERHG